MLTLQDNYLAGAYKFPGIHFACKTIIVQRIFRPLQRIDDNLDNVAVYQRFYPLLIEVLICAGEDIPSPVEKEDITAASDGMMVDDEHPTTNCYKIKIKKSCSRSSQHNHFKG